MTGLEGDQSVRERELFERKMQWHFRLGDAGWRRCRNSSHACVERRGMNRRARWHETKILFVNQPLVFLCLRLARFGGKVCRIPGVGYIINDPHLARAVLAESDKVRPSGPGGIGDFINQPFCRGRYQILQTDSAVLRTDS